MFNRIRSFAWLALGFAALCLPLILSRSGGYSADEERFHLPEIRQIRGHWPSLDLTRDSFSAISPGYHYFLATVSLVTGTGRLPLRGVNWCLSLALLWVLWRRFPAERRPLAAAALLPLACSNFFIKSACWIVTDNPALLGMAVVLGAVTAPGRLRSPWAQGATAAATTFVRQTYAWLAVPVALAGLRRPGREKLGAAAAMLPLAVVGILAVHWGGLVPPAWHAADVQDHPGAFGFASIAYLLSVNALLGVPYCVAAGVGSWKKDAASSAALLGAAVGLVAALAGPTDFNADAGRWGGYLWPIAAAMGAPWHRSVLFVFLAPFGGILAGAMATRLAHRRGAGTALAWLVSYIAWASTFVVNRQVFHRYYEPPTLVFLILWLSLATPDIDGESERTGMLHCLAAVQVAITLVFAYGRTFLGI